MLYHTMLYVMLNKKIKKIKKIKNMSHVISSCGLGSNLYSSSVSSNSCDNLRGDKRGLSGVGDPTDLTLSYVNG